MKVFKKVHIIANERTCHLIKQNIRRIAKFSPYFTPGEFGFSIVSLVLALVML